MIPFAEWLPDQADLNNPGATVAKNVYPHAMGYKPIPSGAAYSSALTAYCRGAIYVRDKANNVELYAGDATKLQKLSNTSWTDVTRSADPYATATSPNGGERWQFAKFGETLLATNYTDEVQSITLGGANFADLGGTPPNARYITTAKNFVILGNINEVGGDGQVPYRIQWSGLGSASTWTRTATNQADEEDLRGTGGWVQQIFGGEFVVVFQENTVWRMDYVGAPTVWAFSEVGPGVGLLSPGMAAQHGEDVYFLSPRGFMVIKAGTTIQPIGNSRVDQFVLNDIDTGNLYRCSSVVDNLNHRVLFAYPGSGNSGGQANKIVIYDFALDRWSYSEQEVQAFLIGATAGYTLETLDNVNASLDALTASLDSEQWTGGRGQLAKFDTDNKLAFYTGSNMSATIETAELQITPQRRTLLTDVRPLVDGGTTTIQVGTRNVQTGMEAWTTARSVNSNGRASVRRNARYHRIRANISGDWTQAQGVEVEGAPAGWR